MHRVVCIERLRARRDGWWGNVTLFGFGRSSPFAAIGLLSTTSGQARCCHHVYFLDLPLVYSCIVAPIDNHWSGDELSCHSTRLLANDHTRQPMNWAEIFGISGRGWWYILLMEQFSGLNKSKKFTIPVLDLISLSRNYSYILLTGLRELKCFAWNLESWLRCFLAFWYIFRK